MNRARQEGRCRDFEISHPTKLLFPDDAITKADLIDYYERITDAMLPHVRGRLVMMHRFPDGIRGNDFYQKDVPDYFPRWIHTVAVKKEEGELRQLTIENGATLAWLANQGTITVHVGTSRCDAIRQPDRLVFDLDPSEDSFAAVRAAARAARELLESLGMRCWPMTTGSRGLHVVAPLDRSADFDEVRAFAADAAGFLAQWRPDELTVEIRKNKRRGRVFVDYLRNAYAQYAVAPYSVRALPGAPVATPLDWDDIDRGLADARHYSIANVFRRLAQKKDPWRQMETHAISVGEASRRLRALGEEAGFDTSD